MARQRREPLVLHRDAYLKSSRMLYEVVEVEATGALLRNCVTDTVHYWPNDALIDLEEVIPLMVGDVDSLL